jgi:hypothetical protein
MIGGVRNDDLRFSWLRGLWRSGCNGDKSIYQLAIVRTLTIATKVLIALSREFHDSDQVYGGPACGNKAARSSRPGLYSAICEHHPVL